VDSIVSQLQEARSNHRRDTVEVAVEASGEGGEDDVLDAGELEKSIAEGCFVDAGLGLEL